MRDITKAQFVEALTRHGMTHNGMGVLIPGYVNLGIPGHSLHVYAPNAGDKRRAQLAYLLREKARYCKEFGVNAD